MSVGLISEEVDMEGADSLFGQDVVEGDGGGGQSVHFAGEGVDGKYGGFERVVDKYKEVVILFVGVGGAD